MRVKIDFLGLMMSTFLTVVGLFGYIFMFVMSYNFILDKSATKNMPNIN